MKIIAYYLPQFHEIPENNEMWGKGFTEWTNVKKAIPLYKGHEQPVEPLNDNYYNLLDNNVMKWQTDLAKKYGIYGFCFYHYWYNGHLLLEKPILNYLEDKSIDFPFCICWANHDWTSTWAGSEIKVIYRQNYRDRDDWDNHFNFLLPFLRDQRYIKIDGKPLVVLYEVANHPFINQMLDRWQVLAKENGVGPLVFAHQSVTSELSYGVNLSRFDYNIEYQPQYVRELVLKNNNKIKMTIQGFIKLLFETFNIVHTRKTVPSVQANRKPTVVDYDDIWDKVINMRPSGNNSIPGAFVKMDTTPRIRERGFVTQGMTPDKLYKNLKRQISNCKANYKTDIIFMFAWNEWAEGGYLEPDKKWGYGVLEAIKKALMETS